MSENALADVCCVHLAPGSLESAAVAISENQLHDEHARGMCGLCHKTHESVRTMNLALHMRGFRYLERDRCGFPTNGLHCVEFLEQCTLAPLRQQHDVKVFVATYESHICGEVINALPPDGKGVLDGKTSSQSGTFESGIERVSTSCRDADRVICTRFDSSCLKSIERWNIWGEEKVIYMPWREYEVS